MYKGGTNVQRWVCRKVGRVGAVFAGSGHKGRDGSHKVVTYMVFNYKSVKKMTIR